MPVNEATVRKQIERFADYPGYPETDKGLSELAGAFRKAARDDPHAVEIGDYLIRTSIKRCPLPGNVYAAAEIIAEHHRYDKPGEGAHCSHCQDTGWIYITSNGVARCDCQDKPQTQGATK